MAAMTTALTEFSDQGNSRTYTLAGHTALSPELVIQRRRVPAGNQVVAEDNITVLKATEDADGVVLNQKVSMQVIVKRPISGQSADVTSVLSVLRDIVAGDEFANTVDTQEYLI